MTDPRILREADALLSDSHAFAPAPMPDEAPGWLSWLAGVGFVAMLAFWVLAA